MAFHWWADDGPTLNAGLVACDFKEIRTSISREPHIYVIFQGGGGLDPPAPSPPLDPHMFVVNDYKGKDISVCGNYYILFKCDVRHRMHCLVSTDIYL